MTQYEPGRMYVATVRGVRDVRVVRTRASDYDSWFCPVYQDTEHGNGWWPDEDEVTDVHPLVTLDIEEPRVFAKWLRSGDGETRIDDATCESIADQIEAQTKPPRPDEPTGMGAVVEDANGEKYVGLGDYYAGGQLRWKGSRRMTFTSYDRIDAVKILHPGI